MFYGKKNKKTAVFVLGMDRSGTSALTGILNILGIPIGDNPLPPAADNPKGFFEQKDILQINEEIFSSMGKSSWFYQVFPIIDPNDEKNLIYVNRIEELLKRK